MTEQFYSTIVGAIIALSGVLLTLRWNQRLHEKSLREEREKVKNEREFNLKQNALLSAAEAVTRFLTYYVTLADRTLPTDGTIADELTEMSVALNHLHFFCDLETIERSTCLDKILIGALSEAMKAKLPSAIIVEELKSIELQVTAFEEMNKDIQEEIKSLLQSDPNNPLLMNHRKILARNFENISQSHERRVELFKQKYIETEKCRDVIIKNLRFISESTRDVFLLARRELSFPINEEEYKAIMDDRIESMEKILKDLFIEIRSQVEDKIK